MPTISSIEPAIYTISETGAVMTYYPNNFELGGAKNVRSVTNDGTEAIYDRSNLNKRWVEALNVTNTDAYEYTDLFNPVLSAYTDLANYVYISADHNTIVYQRPGQAFFIHDRLNETYQVTPGSIVSVSPNMEYYQYMNADGTHITTIDTIANEAIGSFALSAVPGWSSSSQTVCLLSNGNMINDNSGEIYSPSGTVVGEIDMETFPYATNYKIVSLSAVEDRIFVYQSSEFGAATGCIVMYDGVTFEEVWRSDVLDATAGSYEVVAVSNDAQHIMVKLYLQNAAPFIIHVEDNTTTPINEMLFGTDEEAETFPIALNWSTGYYAFSSEMTYSFHRLNTDANNTNIGVVKLPPAFRQIFVETIGGRPKPIFLRLRCLGII
jgi:hypothetical protein